MPRVHVIRPSLIWCDQRSQTQVDAIHAKLGRENVLRYTANPVLTGFTLPKLLWVRDHEPQHFERVRKMLLPKDYVRFRLTGEYATDVSDASGTAVFDVVNRRWSFEMMDGLGLDRSLCPHVRTNRAKSPDASPRRQRLRPVSRWALPWWAAAAIRLRAPSATASSNRESCRAPSARRAWSSRTWKRLRTIRPDASTPSATPLRGKWHVMGVTQGAGLSLQWFRNQLACPARITMR